MTGPPWWGDDWATRAGQRVRGRARDLYEERSGEATAEAAGLLAELDRLPPDVALLLVGTSGATRLASRWADDHERLTVRVPAGAVDAEAAETLAVEIALAMDGAGRLVKALVCVAEVDAPAVGALRARGLAVRPVLPLFPEPETESDDAAAEGAAPATAGAV